MIATVSNFGDGLGVKFSKSLLKTVHIYENDDVEVFVSDNCIIIKRQGHKKHLTTKERIAAFRGINENIPTTEIDWGTPQGREIW